MTRKKVKLAFIENDSARNATFKKRIKGLMKKVSELSTLCGIDACAIVYSPYDPQPEVWPSHLAVQRILSQFKRMPEMEQSKKMVNQESFLRQRIIKSSEKLNKQARDNRELEMIQIMFQGLVGNIPPLNLMDLNDLNWVIEQYLNGIYKRSETLNNMAMEGTSSSVEGAMVATTAVAATPAPQPLAPAPDHGRVMYIGESSHAASDGGEMSMDSMQQLGLGMDDTIVPFRATNPNPHWCDHYIP